MKDIGGVPKAKSGDKDREIPNMFNVLVNSVYTMERAIVKSKIKQANVTISPDIRNLGMLDFFRGEEVVARGYEAASNKLSRLVKRLQEKQNTAKKD